MEIGVPALKKPLDKLGLLREDDSESHHQALH